MYGSAEYFGTPKPEHDFSGGNPDTGFSSSPETPDPDLSFDSLGGCEELIEEVKARILFPVHNPEFVKSFGQTPPKGILLHGPPGTGKTLFAKCLASEMSRLEGQKFSFFMRRGSDMMSMWVGSSEKNLREVFKEAVRRKPSIIFFDEIDSLAPNRNSLQGAIPVYVNVVTTLLVEIDKLKSSEVMIICATNRVDAVDPALKRPGRCDVILQFHPPAEKGRRQIIQLCTRSWKTSLPSPQLLDTLVASTNGFTGADLAKLCSEAFFSCVRRTSQDSKGKVTRGSANETVTESDWALALQATSASAPNIFGSYIQVLQASRCVQPLVQSIARSLADHLEQHFPHCSLQSQSSTTYTSVSCQNANLEGPNCFLAWTAVKNDENVLDLLIIPSALQFFTNLTVFELSEKTMLQEYKYMTVTSIIDIVTQAKNHPKPTVLFIPGIDKLACRLSGELRFIRNLLFNTSSTSTLVLATAGCPIKNLPTELQPLFDGYKKSYQVEQPSQLDRFHFFHQIFSQYGDFASVDLAPSESSTSKGASTRGRKSQSLEPKRKRPRVEKHSRSTSPHDSQSFFACLLQDIVSSTNQEDLWSLITFHRELTQACQKFQEDQEDVPKELHTLLKTIVSDYRLSKLENKR